MKTEDLLKELENEQFAEEPSQQMDITQLQGALILIQDHLANQQKAIVDLARTTNGISNSASAAHRDLNNKLDMLPDKVNDTYSKAVSALSKTMQDKVAYDNRIANSITDTTEKLITIQNSLNEAVCAVSKAAKSVDSALNTTTNLYQRIYIDQWMHYIFLVAFVIWLAYARYQSWGNEFLISAVSAISIVTFVCNYRLK
ncbi:MAG: hypothetical protein ACI3WT_03550 [Phascolarctobacterium sp.]